MQSVREGEARACSTAFCACVYSRCVCAARMLDVSQDTMEEESPKRPWKRSVSDPELKMEGSMNRKRKKKKKGGSMDNLDTGFVKGVPPVSDAVRHPSCFLLSSNFENLYKSYRLLRESMLALGFRCCAEEAIRYLVEEEALEPSHPAIRALRSHLSQKQREVSSHRSATRLPQNLLRPNAFRVRIPAAGMSSFRVQPRNNR
ncbi:unnamed protein product [Darwinula stevensoni]|uniref:Uncharacterized protein n=1 Tax=Darwinula stevensoni TaxID=69355 RepID=A0A7R9A7D2_9CRUS|nr:unnamed protein product [Darwinula stevensoni]CAG0892779.1 unnamed protein product [Darwinula stevensoni]